MAPSLPPKRRRKKRPRSQMEGKRTEMQRKSIKGL